MSSLDTECVKKPGMNGDVVKGEHDVVLSDDKDNQKVKLMLTRQQESGCMYCTTESAWESILIFKVAKATDIIF